MCCKFIVGKFIKETVRNLLSKLIFYVIHKNFLKTQISFPNDLLCVEWDIKPYTLTQSRRSCFVTKPVIITLLFNVLGSRAQALEKALYEKAL